MRRKWSASRVAFELDQGGTPVSRHTVTRLLAQLGLNACLLSPARAGHEFQLSSTCRSRTTNLSRCMHDGDSVVGARVRYRWDS